MPGHRGRAHAPHSISRSRTVPLPGRIESWSTKCPASRPPRPGDRRPALLPLGLPSSDVASLSSSRSGRSSPGSIAPSASCPWRSAPNPRSNRPRREGTLHSALERRADLVLPTVLGDLAGNASPDYLDDVLAVTAQTRQPRSVVHPALAAHEQHRLNIWHRPLFRGAGSWSRSNQLVASLALLAGSTKKHPAPGTV